MVPLRTQVAGRTGSMQPSTLHHMSCRYRSHSVVRVPRSHTTHPVYGMIYELRTYEAAPGKLPALNARFRDHTRGLFERHGHGGGRVLDVRPRRESLAASAYDDAGLSYRLPDHAHAELSGKW